MRLHLTQMPKFTGIFDIHGMITLSEIKIIYVYVQCASCGKAVTQNSGLRKVTVPA